MERIKNLVSIIVTSHNRAKYVPACLNSLIRQTYHPIEIIFVDDASSDHTKRTLRRWKSTLTAQQAASLMFTYIRIPRNIGFSGAVNVGCFLALGEFIASQDSDDLSHPDRIRKQVQFLKKHPDYGLVGTTYVAFRDGYPKQHMKPGWLKYGDEIYETYKNGGHCISHGTILYRAELFDRLGGPTRRLEGAEDYEFIAKCVNDNVKVENLRDILYFYRSHTGQRSRKYYR